MTFARATLALGLLANAAQAFVVADKSDSFDHVVATVNSKAGATWKAEIPARFETVDQGKRLCGSWLRDNKLYDTALEPASKDVKVADALPTDFDGRTQWPKCTVIGHVRDQSACGELTEMRRILITTFYY